MDKTPEELRHDIEETRERMGDTVEALGYKADVPARAKDAVNDRIESVKHAVSDAVDAVQTTLGSTVHNVQSSTGDVLNQAQPHVEDLRNTMGSMTAGVANASQKLSSGQNARAALSGLNHVVHSNPLGIVLGAVALGYLFGSLLPVSILEREKIGPIGEMLTDNAKHVASDLIDQGKAAASQVVTDVFLGQSPKT